MFMFGKRKKFEINKADVEYKVHYLGNVMTSIMKGDGCVDKAVNILWDNHLKNKGKCGIKMNLALTQGGLKVETETSGLTEYYGHRIHYIIAHQLHPKLFVWVYQHVGRNLKTELRCHGVLCKKSTDAKLIAFMLNDRLVRTFAEYKREKKRMQTTRLCGSKNRIFLLESKQPMRNKSLSSTIKFYKPPIQRTMISAPKLDDVQEEDDELVLDGKKEDERVEEVESIINSNEILVDENLIEEISLKYDQNENLLTNKNDDSSSIYSNTCDSGIEESFTVTYEFGNDIEQLKQDKELLKAYQELIVKNRLKINNQDDGDENETSNKLNNLTIKVDLSPSTPTKIVSYDYLADLINISDETAKTKSFRLNNNNPFYLRNPFKRLQSSSSFSSYSTFEKLKLQKQKEQQQQQDSTILISC